MTTGEGPLSWRDVYKAVNEAETRLSNDIAEMRTAVLSVTTDHESRLRVVEQAQLLGQGKAQGVAFTIGTGKAAVLFVVSLVGPIIAIIGLFANP